MSTNPNTPFARLRFDVDSLWPNLSGGEVVRPGEQGMRLGLPADLLLDDALRIGPLVPRGVVERLHALVDELAEDTAV